MDHVPIAGRVVSGKMIRQDQPWFPPLEELEETFAYLKDCGFQGL